MMRYLLGSTVLVGAVFFNYSLNAAVQPQTLRVPQLKISGNTCFNSWFYNNKKNIRPHDAKNNPWTRQNYGRGQLFTVDDSRLRFNVDGKTDPGMEYGMAFVLDGDMSSEKAFREGYIHMGGSWGKFTFGDTYGVESTMAFGGWDQWGGTGFVDGSLDRVVNYTYGTLHSVDLSGETSRDTKLTYNSPRYKGIQLGVSYTPRTEHRGQMEANSRTSTKSPKKPFDTDNIASGLNFIHKFHNGFQMALSATSVFAVKSHPEYKGAPKRKDTASYAFGGTFSYADIGFSAEYGNNGRSQEFVGTSGHKSNAGQFLDFGLSYTWGSTKFSTGYFYGWRKALVGTTAFNAAGKGFVTATETKKAKTKGVSAAVDRKLAPGLGIYMEYARLQMKNPAAKSEAGQVNGILDHGPGGYVAPIGKNTSNVFVVGTRLVF